MYNFEGRNVLVTGSSRGIGKKIAEEFITHGARVFITGTNEAILQQMKQELGPKCDYFTCNLSQIAEIEHLYQAAVKFFGPIDTLINNAGITRDGLFLRMSQDDWMNVMQVNLHSAVKLSQLVIRSMIKNKFGRIINISSIIGSTGNGGQSNYAASKAGILGFSKSLAIEIANRGVTVNCVSPGYIQTEMTDKLPEDIVQRWRDGIPLKRGGSPKDVANACLFLASDLSNYITGQVLQVDGGMLT